MHLLALGAFWLGARLASAYLQFDQVLMHLLALGAF